MSMKMTKYILWIFLKPGLFVKLLNQSPFPIWTNELDCYYQSATFNHLLVIFYLTAHLYSNNMPAFSLETGNLNLPITVNIMYPKPAAPQIYESLNIVVSD